MEIAKDHRPEPSNDAFKTGRHEGLDLPKTLNETVDTLMNELSLKDKNTIANMDEADLINLHFTLGLSIRNKFLYPRNEQLLESCRFVSKDKYLHWDEAASVIIRELWKRLRETHKLRVVR